MFKQNVEFICEIKVDNVFNNIITYDIGQVYYYENVYCYLKVLIDKGLTNDDILNAYLTNDDILNAYLYYHDCNYEDYIEQGVQVSDLDDNLRDYIVNACLKAYSEWLIK